jgi:glycosyltransferase involved in cell wall biosynthesis
MQCAHYEARFCHASHAVVATCDIDASKLRKIAPNASIFVIPYSVDSPQYERVRSNEGFTLLFSGTLTYRPNVEGLHWFAKEVLPRLRAALGDQLPRIVVAGSNPDAEFVRHLRSSGIEVYANPVSMVPLLAEAAVVFVPIRTGSGTRLKILEAMAAGRAVVSTGKGAEGLTLTPSHDIYIADRPDSFTSAILRLLREPKLRQEIGAHAAKTIQRQYDWRCARGLVEQVLDRAVGN